MKQETVRRVYLTAEEIAQKFGLVGEVVTFNTPPIKTDGAVAQRVVLIVLKVSDVVEKQKGGKHDKR